MSLKTPNQIEKSPKNLCFLENAEEKLKDKTVARK